MNFLSHFYFEKFTTSSAQVVGAMLPDLLKNADKTYVFHPHRFEDDFRGVPDLMDLYLGWQRHLEIDRVFHNCDFFFHHSHQLRVALAPVLETLPIRASFFGHIALELLLDHLLIRDDVVSVDRFYHHLGHASRDGIARFLKIIGLEDQQRFFNYYDAFLQWNYVYDYAVFDKITPALLNISKRVWRFETHSDDIQRISAVLGEYLAVQLSDCSSVYQDIQDSLSHLS